MFQVLADKAKNLVQINFSGQVNPDEARRCTETLEATLADVIPGFRLLTDLTGLNAMDTGCTPYIRRAMDVCNNKGVALVVRVIPDPHKDIGFSILSIFSSLLLGVAM